MGQYVITTESGKKYKVTTESPKTIGEKAEDVAKTGMEIAGGIGGGIAGGMVGHPIIGGGIGSAVGRAAGEVADLYNAGTAGPAMIGANIGKTKQLAKEAPGIAKRSGVAGAADLAFGVAGAPIAKGVKAVGKGVAEQLLGPRVAQRGFQRGFDKLLQKEFFKEGMPAKIKERVINFFPRLTKTLGENVSDTVKASSAKASKIPVTEIQDSVLANSRKVLDEGISINDLNITSPAQGKYLANEIDRVMKMPQKQMTVEEAWNARRALDKRLKTKSLQPEAQRIMQGVRGAYNDAIFKYGDDAIRDSFGKYHKAIGVEDSIGKYFEGVEGISGKMYAPKTEAFASNVLKTNKDELIGLLKDADVFQNADNKVIEDFLDYAASESLDKDLPLGYFQKVLAGVLGGKKSIAKLLATTQNPQLRMILKTVQQGPRAGKAALITAEGERGY